APPRAHTRGKVSHEELVLASAIFHPLSSILVFVSNLHPDPPVLHPHRVRRDFLHKRRRRAPILRPVLITVPRAGHATVNDPSFAKRPALIRTHIGDGRDLIMKAKHGDTLALLWAYDAGAILRDLVNRADFHPTPAAGLVPGDLAPARRQVQSWHQQHHRNQ